MPYNHSISTSKIHSRPAQLPIFGLSTENYFLVHPAMAGAQQRSSSSNDTSITVARR